ncbi:MAG: hypothetical protein IPN71_17070 [Fibrobacteres bacterium]|nr:hypothetical protein [Fibrobacterota bacterium]
MFRKALFPLLCAATVAAAIPLKMGESWVWQVCDRDSTTLAFHRGTVIGSRLIPEGTLWQIQGCDTLSSACDTGMIFERRDGKQRWLKISSFLRFELQPPPSDSNPDTAEIVESDTTYSWGEASTLANPRHSLTVFLPSGLVFTTIPSNDPNARYFPSPPVDTFPAPRGKWSADRGLEKFDGEMSQVNTFRDSLFKRPDGLFKTRFQAPLLTHRMEWELVQHGNQVGDPKSSGFNIPGQNSKFVWNFQNSRFSESYLSGMWYSNGSSLQITDSGLIQWDIISQKPDSGLWLRIGIREQKSYQRKILAQTWLMAPKAMMGPTNESSANLDSLLVRTDLTLHLRINRRTGQFFQNAGFDQHFIRRWVRYWGEGFRLGDSSLQTSTTHLKWRSLDGFEIQENAKDFANGLNDSSHHLSSNDNGQSHNKLSFASKVQFQKSQSWILQDSSKISIRPRPTYNLSSIAKLSPATPIRWSTLSGRSGSLLAGEFVRLSNGFRGQVLILEARLPDGQIWRETQWMR